ncbi:MAG: acetate--CoA ligase family protein [Candidatus Peribacteraceae bacterium]|jgi:acetyltransferase|nr:acetate--CoA ligase family protein [Candidatus Peribacteraceae bacterium]|tara:strand:- start:7661 stop:9727 length:2067 start_codon:yes stop_codon:yes gene_type:complete
MSLFEPKSIAVIGASPTEGKVGHDVLKNLIDEGYGGDLFPINPKHEEVLGKKTYKSVKEVDEPIELAVIVVPAKIVPAVLEECAEKKIENVIIISAGFAETGTEEGKDLEEQIKTIAQEHDINLIGPNCLGILRPSFKMNASFAAHLPPKGSIALISQSGAMAVAVMDASQEIGIGYSLIASIGNKAVMDESDLLERAGQDSKTSVVGFYLESISDGKRFLQTCIKVGATKKIVILKAGVSKEGSEAAASHTGALAGSEAAIDALCAQSGAVRAKTMEEFVDMLEVLSTSPLLPSPNIAIITNAGGPGILATDAAEKAKLQMPSLDEKIEKKLKEALPDAASTGNPIDVVGDADLSRYEAALEAVGDDPNIDGVAILLTPQVMTPVEDITKAIISWQKRHSTMPIVTSFMGDEHVNDARLTVQKAGISSFETPERAIAALGALQKSDHSPHYDPKAINDVRAAAASELLEEYTGLIPEDAVGKLFELYGIPLPDQKLATAEEEAIKIAEDIGYPVIAKISSPTILHKTDIGAVKAHLLNEDDVSNAWNAIQENTKKHHPDAQIRGILIQKYLDAGNEFIVGAVRDKAFGHLVMAGLGGIYTELLQDTAFRIAPIDQEEAYRLLQDLISWDLLLGMRGKARLDIESVAKLLETVSQLVTECPQIKDIDLNPVFVHEDSVVVADAKVVIG